MSTPRLCGVTVPTEHDQDDDATAINSLAQAIRRVDGQHTLGAVALAELLLPELRNAQARAVARHGAAIADTIEDDTGAWRLTGDELEGWNAATMRAATIARNLHLDRPPRVSE